MQPSRKELRWFCQRNAFTIEEQEIAHGWRCDVGQGGERVNVNFYLTGKVLVQGKACELKAKVEEFFRTASKPSPAASPLQRLQHIDHSGVDESGKGDYFGPLTISGVYLNRDQLTQVRSWGVRDSKQLHDKEIVKLAKLIKQECVHRSLVFAPPLYNQRYQQFKNLNKLLAHAHAKVIMALVEATDCAQVISDKFAAAHLIPSYFNSTARIELTQVTRAERDPAVACASVLARANFLQGLATLSQQHGVIFLRGATGRVKKQARTFAQQNGEARLAEVAKAHFKML